MAIVGSSSICFGDALHALGNYLGNNRLFCSSMAAESFLDRVRAMKSRKDILRHRRNSCLDGAL
jgi:hypothetical protein